MPAHSHLRVFTLTALATWHTLPQMLQWCASSHHSDPCSHVTSTGRSPQTVQLKQPPLPHPCPSRGQLCVNLEHIPLPGIVYLFVGSVSPSLDVYFGKAGSFSVVHCYSFSAYHLGGIFKNLFNLHENDWVNETSVSLLTISQTLHLLKVIITTQRTYQLTDPTYVKHLMHVIWFNPHSNAKRNLCVFFNCLKTLFFY